MRNYGTARSLFGFMEFIAWSVVVIGGIFAVVSVGSAAKYAGAAGLLAVIPGLAISLGGLFLVAFVQVGRANVDTAEYTQQMLKIARDQLEVSRQGLKRGHRDEPSFTAKANEKGEEASTSPSFGDLRAIKDQPTSSDAAQIEDRANRPKPALRDDFKYRGHIVNAQDDTYVLDGKNFDTKEQVIAYIDNMTSAKPRKIPSHPFKI